VIDGARQSRAVGTPVLTAPRRLRGPDMPSPAPLDRAAQLAPWIGGLVIALPVLLVAFPPMADLPLHEASVGLLRHWSDPIYCPHGVYFVNLGHANQLFSLVVLAASYVVPIAWASKLAVAVSLVALPVSAARFADYLGAPRWTALLVAPLGLGWLFFWGLIQNIVGLVALLSLLPNIDRFASRPTTRGALAMCGAMVLFHFAHQAMQIVACVALVFCSIGAPMRLRANALRAVPVVFSGALVFAANRYAWSVSGPRHKSMALFEWNDPLYKLSSIPGVLFAGYEPYIRDLVFLLALAPIALLVAGRVAQRSRERRPLGERLHAVRFEILALVLFAGYMAAPSTVKSTTLVYHRFLPPAWALFVVSGAAGTAATARMLPRALCALVPVASLLIGWPTFVDADRMYSDLDALMPKIDIGSTVMALNLGPDPPTRLWGPMAAMGHVIAKRGGRSLFDYTQSPTSPLAMRPRKQWVESIARLEKHPYDFTPSWDFTRYRYLLVTTPTPTLAVATALALRKEALLVATQGDWYLFESRLPLVPIDANDAWPPKPHPLTLQQELRLVSREIEAIESAGAVASE
jgi:hypothetical protein